MDDVEATRRSWNVATANHDQHKGDQAAFLRNGGDTLFPEERALLGSIDGLDLVHLQCNAGQDSLCLARRGARVTGVDLSDEAVARARALSEGSGIPATFVRSEILAWMGSTDARFDVAFASYGALPWVADIGAWMAGAARVLRPGGRLVVQEFHPVVWSLGPTLSLDGDDYFHPGPYRAPVGDYVAVARGVEPLPNTEVACGWQHTVADWLQALVDAGLQLERVAEQPWSNFARLSPGLVSVGEGRWGFPEGKGRIPLMFGFVARRPS